MIDNIAIDFQSSENFASIKDIRKKCNPIVNLFKFIFNKKILNEIVVLCSCVLKILSILKKKKNCNQTLYYKKVLE